MTTQPIEQEEETANVKQMRETLERQSAEIEVLRADQRENLMEKAGFDPTTGIGKAVAKDISRGEYEGEMTAEALQEYAKQEYTWVAEAASETTETEETAAVAKVVAEGTKQVEQVQNAGSPPTVEDPADRAETAEADQDWTKQIMEGTTVTVEGMT